MFPVKPQCLINGIWAEQYWKIKQRGDTLLYRCWLLQNQTAADMMLRAALCVFWGEGLKNARMKKGAQQSNRFLASWQNALSL